MDNDNEKETENHFEDKKAGISGGDDMSEALSVGNDNAQTESWPEAEQPTEHQETIFKEGCSKKDDLNTTEPVVCGSNANPEDQKRTSNKGKFHGNMSLWIILGIVSAGLLGFGGGMAAANSVGNRLEAELQNNLTEMMEEAGGTVLYRSVDTEVNTTEEIVFSVPAITELCADAVVEIQTEVSVSGWGFFGPSSYVREGAGSGIIISDNGYILTCNHVVADAKTINVAMRNDESFSATLVASDEQSDVAILKIEAENLTVAVMGDSDELEVGDPVVAIGNPLGKLGGTVTAGIISALDREVTIENKGTYNVLQTDAAINSGNSGGGLFNSKGELIGLINAKASEIGVEGLGFALPIKDIKPIIEDLLNYGYVTTRGATLGVVLIDILDERTAASYQVDELGCYILRVNMDSNASYAGLQSGDLIISIDDISIKNANQVVDIIGSHVVNDKIQMTVKRNGKLMDFTITLYGVVPNSTETKPAARP